MATAPKGTDRRVRRTRQLIRQAFLDVVREKGLLGASVQEIAERANVSRGTFYAHYADKYELVDSLVREEFRRAISSSELTASWNRQTLFSLIQTVLENFKRMYLRHHRAREFAPILEQAFHDELSAVLFALLKQSQSQEWHSSVSLEMTAQVIGWTIYGAAVQWSQLTAAITSEQMAHEVEQMILDGVRLNG